MNLETLNTLQTEHRCLLGQAAQIEEQLDWIRRARDPDYGLLNDRVEFLKEHYIEVHCPKDKVMMEKLVGGSGNLGAVMAPFLIAHETAFLANMKELAAGLKAVLTEQMVHRADLLRYGDAALYHLREQIATEEAGPLPWARRRLRRRDWNEVAAAHGTAQRWQGADCTNIGHLFPRLERQASPPSSAAASSWERRGNALSAPGHRDGDY